MLTDNILFSKGVVPYFKGSLEFSIIGETLILQGGIAYDEKGVLLKLVKASYTVLDNIDLLFFENYEKYHFYLTLEENFNRIVLDHVLVHRKLEDGIYFFITKQQCDDCVLLGELEIDYDLGNEQNIRSIAIPNNAFCAEKNEINIKNISRHWLLPSPITERQSSRMSQTLLKLAQIFHHKMVKEKCMEFTTLSSTFFQFSDDIKSQRYSPYEIYQKFENHIALFNWVDSGIWKREEADCLEKLAALFDKSIKKYKTTYYHFNIDESESLFYQIFNLLENLIIVFQNNKVFLSANDKEEFLDDISQSLVISENFEEENIIPNNITIVEDTTEEDESPTVLLGGDREGYVQVGRGSQSGNDIVLGENDKTVSRIHLKITAHKQGFFLEDLSSMGTYVNGERIEKNVKKFVTIKHSVILGKKNCTLDLTHNKIYALLNK